VPKIKVVKAEIKVTCRIELLVFSIVLLIQMLLGHC